MPYAKSGSAAHVGVRCGGLLARNGHAARGSARGQNAFANPCRIVDTSTAATGKAAGNLAGYRVHWRLTTDAQWTDSVYVGNVSEHTLENIVIDNYFFGVSSVAKDGAESPVVFPGAAGAF